MFVWSHPAVSKILSFLRAMTSPSLFFKGRVGDGREEKLVQHVMLQAEMGNPKSVLEVVDKYATANGVWFMNIGDEKGRVLDQTVSTTKPKVALELGAYCGYSAVRIASQMSKEHPDDATLLISIEMNPDNVNIARRVVEHAGLSSRVKILEGTLSKCMEEVKAIMREEVKAVRLDLVFIDHNKDVYLQDYLLLKQEQLLQKGTVIVADNMGFPGSPSFWAYLNQHPHELQTVLHKTKLEYIGWISDTLTVSTCIV